MSRAKQMKAVRYFTCWGSLLSAVSSKVRFAFRRQPHDLCTRKSALRFMTTPVQTDAERKAKLLEKITEVLGNRKYRDDWTISEVAREVGVARGTIYKHYGTADDLRVAIYRAQTSGRRPLLPAVKGDSEQARIQAGVSSIMDWLDENRDLILSAPWPGEGATGLAVVVAEARQSLARQLAEVHLEVPNPSERLLRDLEVFIGAGQVGVRHWLVEERSDRQEMEELIARLLAGVLQLRESPPEAS